MAEQKPRMKTHIAHETLGGTCLATEMNDAPFIIIINKHHSTYIQKPIYNRLHCLSCHMGLTGFQKKLRASRVGMQQMSEWPIRYCICSLIIITISLGAYWSWETVLSILCRSSFKIFATPCKESIFVPTEHRHEMTHPSLCSWLEGKAEIRTQGYHWTPKRGVLTYMLCSLWPKYVPKNLNADSFPHPCKY